MVQEGEKLSPSSLGPGSVYLFARARARAGRLLVNY
jgi:hypothetical protein